MSLRITQDVAATHAYRNLSVTADQVSKSMDRLARRAGVDGAPREAVRPGLTDRS